jgi:hypothetical protein
MFAKLPPEGTAPYPLMVLAGMLPWTFFATGLSEASNSLINNANLMSKVYFPRLIVPTATVVVAFVDFLITFSMLIVMMAWFHFVPGWRILVLPAFILLAFLASMGPALWISALNVKYRDFRYIIPFIVQFGLYVSPVGFSSSVVPEEWRLLYSINPMVGVIDGFRWCIRNGAGKSTLLKILSRITEPTEGRITINGRVASLLEVGTGFHSELTGRENIYLNGAILGMTRAEIKRKFDAIVAFAEVEKFLDTPADDSQYLAALYLEVDILERPELLDLVALNDLSPAGDVNRLPQDVADLAPDDVAHRRVGTAALGGQSPFYLPGLAASVCVTVIFLWFGLHKFRMTERYFGDLV